MVGTNYSATVLPRTKSTPPRLAPQSGLQGTEYSPKNFVEIVSNYMSKLKYSPRSINIADIMKTHTYRTLVSDLAVYEMHNRWFEATCLTAATLVEARDNFFNFQMWALVIDDWNSSLIQIILQTSKSKWLNSTGRTFLWNDIFGQAQPCIRYLLYVDDVGYKIQPDLQAFQKAFFTNQRSANKVLQGFVDNLADMYGFWDPIAANCISASGTEFVTGRLIEEEPGIKSMEVSEVASSWPNFLRVKTGGALAFAFFLFPTAMFPDISSYIQIVDDVAFITNHANDLLSFHKEALAGETNNYVHARAHATKKGIPDALRDIAEDLLAANTRISEVLKGTAAATAYNDFMVGLLDFHFVMKRYRLEELAF